MRDREEITAGLRRLREKLADPHAIWQDDLRPPRFDYGREGWVVERKTPTGIVLHIFDTEPEADEFYEGARK